MPCDKHQCWACHQCLRGWGGTAAASLVLCWLRPPATLMLHMCHNQHRWRASAGSGLTVPRTLFPVSHSDSRTGLKMKLWRPRSLCTTASVLPPRHYRLEGWNQCSLFGQGFCFFIVPIIASPSCITTLMIVFFPVLSLATKHDDFSIFG